jgi:hypothetical protein
LRQTRARRRRECGGMRSSTCVCIVLGPGRPPYRQQPSQGAPPLLGNQWRKCGGGAGRRNKSARSGPVHNQARRGARPRAGASAAWGHRERTDEHGGTASSTCSIPKPPPCQGRADLRKKPSAIRPATRTPSQTRAARGWASVRLRAPGTFRVRCVCVCASPLFTWPSLHGASARRRDDSHAAAGSIEWRTASVTAQIRRALTGHRGRGRVAHC